jgi:pimeloyl-ACP methyl ester carboxylesterase
VLLLHGFPELAYSWRRILPALAAAGVHAVAPDQRGYGRTAGWKPDYDGDLASFSIPNLVVDACALIAAIGRRSVAAVVGHDFGAPVAAYCALARPDLFRSLVLMSAPFGGPPSPPFGLSRIQAELAALVPPRKHYQSYYATREANADMWRCPQGVHDFLRAYYHMKSADWPPNRPFPLASFDARELAKLPPYYVMEKHKTMAQTVAPAMPSREEIAACKWLPDDELRVYSAEFGRTGFQGGLQWYRCATGEPFLAELHATFGGRAVDVPSLFIAGRSDWGIYQKAGDLERMQDRACRRMLGCHLVEGAGHWVQQEQPERVSALLLEFLRGSV